MRNEATSLRLLLDSIRRQTHPPDEIILVDGGSADGTVEIAKELTADDSRFMVVAAGEATPGRGRNIGIMAARCEWIALTDAGIHLEPSWLERLVEVTEREPAVDVVYGNYEPQVTSFFERCAALAYLAPKSARPIGHMRGPSIASSLLRRSVWEAAGGFPDMRAAEDLIFMDRIREHGFKIGWAPTATAWWQLQPTLGRTFQRFVLYSRHNVWADRQRDWHYGMARKYVVAFPFVGLALLHYPGWLSVPLLGAVARVAKSIVERREGRSIRWLLNPLQFAGVGIILAAIDLATFVGWAQAVWQRRGRFPSSSPTASSEPQG